MSRVRVMSFSSRTFWNTDFNLPVISSSFIAVSPSRITSTKTTRNSLIADACPRHMAGMLFDLAHLLWIAIPKHLGYKAIITPMVGKDLLADILVPERFCHH